MALMRYTLPRNQPQRLQVVPRVLPRINYDGANSLTTGRVS